MMVRLHYASLHSWANNRLLHWYATLQVLYAVPIKACFSTRITTSQQLQRIRIALHALFILGHYLNATGLCQKEGQISDPAAHFCVCAAHPERSQHQRLLLPQRWWNSSARGSSYGEDCYCADAYGCGRQPVCREPPRCAARHTMLPPFAITHQHTVHSMGTKHWWAAGADRQRRTTFVSLSHLCYASFLRAMCAAQSALSSASHQLHSNAVDGRSASTLLRPWQIHVHTYALTQQQPCTLDALP